MGLVAGLAWIIIGGCYMAYKYFNEEWHMSPIKSVGFIAIGWVVFFALGALAQGIAYLQEYATVLYLIIATPIVLGLLALVAWLVFGDVKDAIKDEKLASEITSDNVRSRAQQCAWQIEAADPQLKFINGKRVKAEDGCLPAEAATEFIYGKHARKETE